MALCSVFGGLALANAKLGAVHGFAGMFIASHLICSSTTGVIGGWVDNAPHGAVCARLLPYVLVGNKFIILHFLIDVKDVNVKALRAREPQSPFIAKYDEVHRF